MPPSKTSKTSKPNYATPSLVLGVFSLITWLLPIVGLPVSITGLVLAIKSINSKKGRLAAAALVLCIIGLVLTIANASIGAYLGVTGQHPVVNEFLN